MHFKQRSRLTVVDEFKEILTGEFVYGSMKIAAQRRAPFSACFEQFLCAEIKGRLFSLLFFLDEELDIGDQNPPFLEDNLPRALQLRHENPLVAQSHGCFKTCRQSESPHSGGGTRVRLPCLVFALQTGVAAAKKQRGGKQEQR